jgi:hypothetical protein
MVLKTTGLMVEFDEELWNVAVEKIIVQAEGKLLIKNRTRI